ncbi:MAG: hypothetical protein AAF581_20215 [Planctomycetota bacterium]
MTVALFALGLSIAPVGCDINIGGEDDAGDGGTDAADPSDDGMDDAPMSMDAGGETGNNDPAPDGTDGDDGTGDGTDDGDDDSMTADTGTPDAGGGASCLDDGTCFGSCCDFQTGHVGCDDTDFAAQVCAADPVCCEQGWDVLCVIQLQRLFGDDICVVDVNQVDPGCCTDGSTCDVPEVSECVCAADPFCCEVEWNEFCVEAVDTCASCAEVEEATVCFPLTCGA